MVQIDVPVAFAIGSLFADAASRQLQSGQPTAYDRTLALNNLFHIFFFSWIPIYFLLNYFGWETTHMWWHADSGWRLRLFSLATWLYSPVRFLSCFLSQLLAM